MLLFIHNMDIQWYFQFAVKTANNRDILFFYIKKRGRPKESCTTAIGLPKGVNWLAVL